MRSNNIKYAPTRRKIDLVIEEISRVNDEAMTNL